MDIKHLRRARIAGLVGLLAAAVWAVVVAPPLVGFGLALASALAWCAWLERHQENIPRVVLLVQSQRKSPAITSTSEWIRLPRHTAHLR